MLLLPHRSLSLLRSSGTAPHGLPHGRAALPRLPHGRAPACPASRLRPVAPLLQQRPAGKATAAAALLQRRPHFEGSFDPKLLLEIYTSNSRLCLNTSLDGASCWYPHSKKWLMESHRAVTFKINGSSWCPVYSGEPAPLSCAAPGASGSPQPRSSASDGGGKRAAAAELLPPRWKVLGESRPQMQKYPVCSRCSVLNPVKSVGAFLLIQGGFGSCCNSIINNLR